MSIIGLPLVFFLALLFGEVFIPPRYLIHPEGAYAYILFNIRLPTVIASALIGAILATSGAIMQLLLRNPLMDPYISGTASGGAFGAVLAYYLLAFNLPFSWIAYISPIIAFVFSLVSTLITLLIGRKSGVYGIMIGGVIVSYVFSSIISIMLTYLEERFPQVPPLTFWLLGEIEVVGWFDVVVLAILATVIGTLGIYDARMIDLASISDDLTVSKNVDPNKFRMLWVVLISVATGFIVSMAGIIGFLGIIVPHIIRRVNSGSASKLIPYSLIMGGTVMMASQIVSDGALGLKIPLTAITSILASPIMIYVLVKGIANTGN
ncbi:FecCD family ABC transporter permease [Metallosphaera hakonensis]|uniref:Iron ABC transporter n=1 Tax=Metallosphaera hakonensis JCM 8857 = DSM 7519 TaxID=1293036 RepID=A0A2U9IX82_9CREN|nr:iron ABC transporter permease [Metallosphaera hakonensis]AWS00496.1 iron chelate uptake ABC transporter family permease subunit [Metallosphaera hakonensis JCM 8857 = DSM 7519]